MEENPYEPPKTPPSQQGSNLRIWEWVSRPIGLSVLMVGGAMAGYVAAPFLVMAINGYDHGHETEEFAPWTIIGGALLGLVVHLLIRRPAT